MGHPYYVILFFRRDQVWDVLKSYAEISKKADNREIELTTDSGEKIRLPFSSNFKTDPIQFDQRTGELRFDTVMYIELNEELNDEDWEDYIDEIEEGNKIPFGLIYLRIKFGDEFVIFDFHPATSGMGISFLTSKEIRIPFIDLLKKHDGILGSIRSGTSMDETIFWKNGKNEEFRRPIRWYNHPDEIEDEIMD